MNNTAVATSFLFEGCTPYTSGENPNQQVPIEANFFDRSTPAPATASLHASFGMAGWLAGAIHAIGVEVYVSFVNDPIQANAKIDSCVSLQRKQRDFGMCPTNDNWKPACATLAVQV